MGMKVTTEQFIESATEAHAGRYTYEKSVYTGNKKPVEINCTEHGYFWQAPVHHILRKQGCPKCALIASGVRQKTKAAASFVEKARAVHHDKYDYSKMKYTGSDNKIEIVCKVHSSFWQTAYDHLDGCGCSKCSDEIAGLKRRKSQDEFIKSCMEVHGGAFDYSETVYTLSNKKVKIKCPHHGFFHQIACSHLMGAGCQRCSGTGFQTNKPGFLYVLSCDNLTKIGITNVSVEERARKISRSLGQKFSTNFFIKFADGRIPDAIETTLLKEFKSIYSQPDEVFDGYTECFLDADNEFILRRISEMCIEHLCIDKVA